MKKTFKCPSCGKEKAYESSYYLGTLVCRHEEGLIEVGTITKEGVITPHKSPEQEYQTNSHISPETLDMMREFERMLAMKKNIAPRKRGANTQSNIQEPARGYAKRRRRT